MPSAGPRVKKLRKPIALSVSCPGDSLKVNLRNRHDQPPDRTSGYVALASDAVNSHLHGRAPPLQLQQTCKILCCLSTQPLRVLKHG